MDEPAGAGAGARGPWGAQALRLPAWRALTARYEQILYASYDFIPNSAGTSRRASSASRKKRNWLVRSRTDHLVAWMEWAWEVPDAANASEIRSSD